jgi:hypothetical protein
MKQEPFDVLDPPRAQLRALVAIADEYVAGLSTSRQSRLRQCPTCGRRVPHEATRCRSTTQSNRSTTQSNGHARPARMELEG